MTSTKYLDLNGLTYYTSKITGITDGLQDQIDDLKNIGRFLSNWSCKDGQPTTEPPGLDPGDTFTYQTGDYYLISEVASSGGTNYKPNGSTYIVGSTSSTVETDEVAVGDIYIFDSSQWLLLYNTKKEVTFANISGQPTDNTNLANALDSKVSDVQVNGTSVVTNGVGNVPIAAQSTLGVVKVNANQGVSAYSAGDLVIISANESELIAKTQNYKPIVPSKLDIAVREGLGNNSLTWTDAYKAKARNTIGAPNKTIFRDWA